MIRALLLLLYDVLLINLALEDVKFRKIRNLYITGIVVLAVSAVDVVPEITLSSRIAGMFAVSVPMWCVAMIKPGSFGGGDIKLTFACGAFLGMEFLNITISYGYELYTQGVGAENGSHDIFIGYKLDLNIFKKGKNVSGSSPLNPISF